MRIYTINWTEPRPVQSEINEKVPPEFDKLIDKAIQSLPKDD